MIRSLSLLARHACSSCPGVPARAAPLRSLAPGCEVSTATPGSSALGLARTGMRTEGGARVSSWGSRALPPRRSADLTLQATRPSVPLRKPRPARRAARTQRGGEWAGPGGALRTRGRDLCTADCVSPGEGAAGRRLEHSGAAVEAGRGSGRGLHALGAGPLGPSPAAWAVPTWCRSPGAGPGRGLRRT